MSIEIKQKSLHFYFLAKFFTPLYCLLVWNEALYPIFNYVIVTRQQHFAAFMKMQKLLVLSAFLE
jgi:hypothetical protein